jgi:hypothetical protein
MQFAASFNAVFSAVASEGAGLVEVGGELIGCPKQGKFSAKASLATLFSTGGWRRPSANRKNHKANQSNRQQLGS